MSTQEIQVPNAETVPISQLKTDGQNPNKMTREQLDRLKTSIRKYGFIVPIITNKDLVIADGEQRWIAANELAMKEVSVIRLPVEDVDRRLLRQVLNKLKGEHELLADAHELPNSSHWLIWDKKADVGIDRAFFSDAELIWTNTPRNSCLIYRYLWSGLLRTGARKEELTERVHPTQKPVGLLANIIQDYSQPNQVISDLYGGSGSTLIACEQIGRVCYMMEIDPRYCQVIVDRWQAYTNKKAVKCETSKSTEST